MLNILYLCILFLYFNIINSKKTSIINHKIKLDQTLTPFLDALTSVEPDIRYRFLFPGHNGGDDISQKLMSDIPGFEKVLKYDLPELEELDNVHCPNGPLLESLELAADLFGACRTWFLVNGASSGILIAILSCIKWSKQYDNKNLAFLIPQDSHKAVYDAFQLCCNDINIIQIPIITNHQFDGVSYGINKDALYNIIQKMKSSDEKVTICGLLMTRPTYHGVCTSSKCLTSIIETCHSNQIPVIIDEAHGTHLSFINNSNDNDDNNILKPALHCGADIVIQSAHKTLAAPSQTGYLHLGQQAFDYDGETSRRSDMVQIMQDYYSILTTTSPNSLFLASLDACRAQFATEETQKQLALTINKCNKLRLSLNKAWRLIDNTLMDNYDTKGKGEMDIALDPLRITVQLNNDLFKNEMEELREKDEELWSKYGIVCELDLPTSLCFAIPPLSDHTVDVLMHALNEIVTRDMNNADEKHFDDKISNEENKQYNNKNSSSMNYLCDNGIRSSDLGSQIVSISIEKAEGMIIAETISLYPPGVPLIISGQRITNQLIKSIKDLQKTRRSGSYITGAEDPNLQNLRVYYDDNE